MHRENWSRNLLGAVAVLLCSSAGAQTRGRTDGPENSEFGRGGYEAPGAAGPFSLEADWGASVQGSGTSTGSPLFAGLTLSYWASDWFLLDVTGNYLWNNRNIDALIGPRCRTATYPVSFSLGLKAGVMFLANPPGSGLPPAARFGLAPQVGADILLSRHLYLGLNYAIDIPVGDGDISHRIFLSVGYRF